MLSPGTVVATLSTGRARMERRVLGVVDVPDGKVFACDPLVPMESRSFAHSVPPGAYEAVLFVAVRAEGQAESLCAEVNAAAALVFSADQPVRWERALREGANAEEDSGAYGVDAGTGCLMGSRAAERIFTETDAHPTPGEIILAALSAAKGGVVVDVPDEAAVAAFMTGDGDGVYESWWGWSAQGLPTILVTDFAILEPPAHVDAVHARWAKARAKKWWEIWK
jgi:hypothetical protein